MPSPSAASENVVVYCASLNAAHCQCPCTSNAPPAAWTRVPFSVFHTLRSSTAMHWSARAAVRQGNETMHAARRPTAARYIEAAVYRTILRYRGMKRHDISISLLGYDMITNFLAIFLRPVFSASHVQHVSDLHLKFALRPHCVEVWQTSNLQRLRLGEEKKTSACISLAGVSAMVPFSVFALLVRQRVKEQAGWSLQPDCAPNSKHPQFGMPPSFDRCTPPYRRFNQNIPPSVVLLQQCHCQNRNRDKLQNLSPASVLFESSRIFFTIHRRHRRKE